MRTREDKCCGTCEWWEELDLEGLGRSGQCNFNPPQLVYSPEYHDAPGLPSSFNPETGVLHRCGRWEQNTEGRTRENDYGLDAWDEDDEDIESFDDEDGVYRITALGCAWLDTKDDDFACLMKFDREYYNDRHDRFWCDKCNEYVDVDKGEKPKFCLHCGREVYGCFCGGDRMD